MYTAHCTFHTALCTLYCGESLVFPPHYKHVIKGQKYIILYCPQYFMLSITGKGICYWSFSFSGENIGSIYLFVSSTKNLHIYIFSRVLGPCGQNIFGSNENSTSLRFNCWTIYQFRRTPLSNFSKLMRGSK
jgi:hypothetical protein